MLYQMNSWAANASWVGNWWGLGGFNAQEHRFFLGKQQDKVPGAFSLAQRVKLGAPALQAGLRTWQGFVRHTGAAAQPFPPSPCPAGVFNAAALRIWRGQVQSISFRVSIAEFGMLVLSLQGKPSRDSRSTGWYQLIEREFYPRIFVLDS